MAEVQLLRFGEKAEDVFLLNAEVDPERSVLYEKVRQSPDDPELWWRLLKQKPKDPQLVKTYSYLRLYRRATSVLGRSLHSHRTNPAFLHIWLTFALLHRSASEQRDAFKYMKSIQIGTDQSTFYEKYAQFELQNGISDLRTFLAKISTDICTGNTKEAKIILSEGFEKGLFTDKTVEQLLSSYEKSDSCTTIPEKDKPDLVTNKTATIFTPKYNRLNSDGTKGSKSTINKRKLQSSIRLNSTPSVFGTGPRRVTRQEDDDDDDDDKENKNVAKLENVKVEDKKNSATIKETVKQDLSYIRHWKPKPLESKDSKNVKLVQPDVSPSVVPSKKPNSNDINDEDWIAKEVSEIESGSFFDTTIKVNTRENAVEIQAKGTPNSSPSMATSSSSPEENNISPNSNTNLATFLKSVNGVTYYMLEEIGRGGSSKVYRILGPDRCIYALKKIKLKRLDSVSIAEYLNEIKLLKKLHDNEHIIQLLNFELREKVLYVVMELGEMDLHQKLKKNRINLQENYIALLWGQMLQGVHSIHSQRIIHGDLKPANFLFVRGELKLIDFGTAKTISNDTTNIMRDGQEGTVNYMSPEAIQQNHQNILKISRASDIWSLGCILYEMVYGKPPFHEIKGIVAKFQVIIDDRHTIKYPPLANQQLVSLIRSCLQRDPKKRPTIDGENGLLHHPFLHPNPQISLQASIESITSIAELEQLDQLIRKRRQILQNRTITEM